jgi:hypothetical protein
MDGVAALSERVGCSTLEAADSGSFIGTPYEDILVLEDEHIELVKTAHEHHNEGWAGSMLREPFYSEQ